MSTIKIEKGIEMPEDMLKSKDNLPFSEMKLGDSFFMAGWDKKKLYWRASYYRYHVDENFFFRVFNRTEVINKKSVSGSRIWRTKTMATGGRKKK